MVHKENLVVMFGNLISSDVGTDLSENTFE
jgi:hypothetical protein